MKFFFQQFMAASSKIMFVAKLSAFMIIFTLFFMQFQAARKHFEPYIRYTSIKCTSSNKTICDFKCFIKAYSRRNTTLNVIVNISRPLFKVTARFDYSIKSLANSKRSVINSTFDVCTYLNGTTSNPVFKWIIGVLPGIEVLLHPCPYQVSLFYKYYIPLDFRMKKIF